MNCPLTHNKNLICNSNSCDECIQELLETIEEKNKLILSLNKQVAKQHIEITKNKRELLGNKATINNLREQLYHRNNTYVGKEFESKISYKNWRE